MEQKEETKKATGASETEDAYRALSGNNRKMMRQMLLISLAFFGVLLLLAGGILLAGKLLSKNSGEAGSDSIRFYPPYNGDIFADAEYLALDRSISFCADPDGYGETVSITDENIEEFNAEVRFLRDWIRILTEGDADRYNACFTEAYFQTHERQKSFSPQMIWQTVIRYQSVSSDERTGERLVTYRLSYCIHRNDGTLRRDVGSDGSRPQYAVLRIAPDGSIGIDDLYTK